MRFFILFLVLLLAVPVGLTFGQVPQNVVSLRGKDWSFVVPMGGLEKSAYAIDVTKGKELRYVLSSYTEAEKYVDGFRFPVSYSGLTCYYQGELTEEENKTSYRPIDVISSYACFDSSGKKVMHIYRSKLVDAKGSECWLDMKLEKDFLCIFLDFNWLKGAVFPVLLDPTFGETDVGGTNWGIGGYTILNRFAVPEDCEVSKLTIYTYAEADFVGMVYSDDGGSPDELLASKTVSGLPGSWQWSDFTLDTPLSLSAGYCWLGVYSAGTCYVKRDDGAGTRQYVNSAPPNPWSGGSSGSELMSIYATYETGGGDTYTLDLSISQPQNITYSNPSIPITLVVSGNDTGQVTTWNMKFSNGSWLYVSNQTYTGHIHQSIEENITDVLFCGLVVGDTLSHYHEVYFSVYYSDYVAPETSTSTGETVNRYYSDWNLFAAAILLCMTFTLFIGVVIWKKRN